MSPRSKPKKTFDQAVGERLRQMRKDAGKLQSEAGKHIGKTEGQMSRYESGEHPISTEDLTSLAAFYKCDLTYLLTGKA